MKNVLLDTNAYVSLLSGDEAVLNVLANASCCYMSIFVIGELYAGFAGGRKERQNRELLGRFLNRSTVKILNATMETSDLFGHIKNSLKKKGRPIPINDVWIAAHTMETGSTIITYDRHFMEVDGLRVFQQ